MKILIVDGDRETRQHVRGLLEAAGYTGLLEAETSGDAFRLIGLGEAAGKRDAVDVILMATQTDGGVTGVETCRKIKQDPEMQDVAVIMMASEGGAEQLEAAFDAGAIDCLSKPVNRVELLTRMGSVVRMKREAEERRSREVELGELKRQLADARRVMQYLSALDSQTGVADREHLDRALDHEWRRATRGPTPLSAVMIDIDFFKTYSEVYGAEGAEQAQVSVTRSLSGSLRRPADLLGRYDDQRLLVLLPDTPIQGAVAIAEGMRAGIESLGIAHTRSQVSDWVTISLGVSTAVPTVDVSPTTLVAAAQQALGQAKHGGRNRVMVHVLD
ncbi:MAG: diguanylate cyclase [Acidobacteria bacterium]|nr:diguanylate cyclase [Acidobacteriota bacterium]